MYIETSIVSYLTGRASSDPVIAARQAMTRNWWADAPDRFVLVVSPVVLAEAAAGDEEAARRRLSALRPLTQVAVTEEASALTVRLMDEGAFPSEAAVDAAHVGTAATNRVDYLLTWNLRHIANPMTRRQIEQTCRLAGYQPPVICTPEELHREDADASS